MPSASTKNRKNTSPSRSRRRTISCCRRASVRTAETLDELAAPACAVGRAAAPLPPARDSCARADDVADAILMAVDGELIGERRAAALAAQFVQLLLAGRSATPQMPRPTPSHRAHRQPPLAVDVGIRLARIDKVVPQCVEHLEQPVLKLAGNLPSAHHFVASLFDGITGSIGSTG